MTIAPVIHITCTLPDLRNFSFVPDILLPLFRGLGGFFLNCTTEGEGRGSERDSGREGEGYIGGGCEGGERGGGGMGEGEGEEVNCHFQITSARIMVHRDQRNDSVKRGPFGGNTN